jgi:multidrug efflux pump subunit AcrB
MWIVYLALRRPYTVAVMALLIMTLGLLSVSRMIVDIFPAIRIPVVLVVWNYPGLTPEDMERRVVLLCERAYSTTVNGIERIESQSIPGIGLLRIYFQQGADIGAAISQITATSSTVLRTMPPGIQPPNIIQFDASSVPVAQLTLSSDTLSEQEIYDYGLYFVRVRLFTIPGLSTPAPFGGKIRQIMVDMNPDALQARGLSPADVVSALQSSNVIVPAGTARIGKLEYNVTTNSSPRLVEEFEKIPIKVVGNAVVYMGDVARVADSYAEQTNIVRVNGKRATYLAILRHAEASTLAVVDSTRDVLPLIREVAPEGFEMKIDFDQSLFVRAAIEGVLREAVLASILVSMMILVFLGSWQSVVIVCISIPLAILSSIIVLNLAGQSINIMTLGGLALAIGMLVDDATVEVENIYRNRAMGKPLTVAILDGAHQIAVPAIVSTLAICIVFFPVVLLYGPAKYLFTPLALAVVSAMLASYLLSRTLVPTMARMLMAEKEPAESSASSGGTLLHKKGFSRLIQRLNEKRENGFEKLRQGYGRSLEIALSHRAFTLIVSSLVVLISSGLFLVIGTDFFPSVDAGMMKLHFRAPSGTRIEETERMVAKIERHIHEIIPVEELETVNNMIGVPVFLNLAFVHTENIGGMDAEFLIALKKGHRPTKKYVKNLRKYLARKFPGSSLYFQPADIVTQVLNFGQSSPISVQIEGNDLERSYRFASRLQQDLREIPGTADVHINEVLDYPTLQVDVDRARAAMLGMSQREVANTLLTALSSSVLVAPSFFLNPANNVNYSVAVQIPIERLDSMGNLLSIPVTPTDAVKLLQEVTPPKPTELPSIPAQTVGNIAHAYHRVSAENIDHYTVQRVIKVEANVEDRDLGSVAKEIKEKIAQLQPLPAGTRINLRGQNEVMEESFRSLGFGLLLAILLVYFLMVMLFQSWLDPLIIMMAVPGALVGILWMLALTGTTLNVESLMGSIMAVGIATANSILLVNFANDLRMEKQLSAVGAALEAGRTRLRPVMMTALAMIIGMLPMAVGMGEGGEQNAPLGRAVIGGLLLATLFTLFVVPVIYSLLRRKLPTKNLLEQRFEAERQGHAATG